VFLGRIRGRLDGGPVSAEAFERLARHFRDPTSWALFDDVLPTLDRLSAGGLRLAVVSNWDSHLPRLLSDLVSSPDSGGPRLRGRGDGEAGSRDLPPSLRPADRRAGRGAARRRFPPGGLRGGDRRGTLGAPPRPRRPARGSAEPSAAAGPRSRTA
jgi:hypothetical protein